MNLVRAQGLKSCDGGSDKGKCMDRDKEEQQKERLAARAYAAWRRPESLRRYMSAEDAQTAPTIEIDADLFVDYDANYQPLMLVETALDDRPESRNAGKKENQI